MADKPTHRSYEILAEISTIGSPKPAFLHRGTQIAGSAEVAIRENVEERGLPEDPYTPTGRYVAVPTSNWNKRTVEVTQVPKVEVHGGVIGAPEPAA